MDVPVASALVAAIFSATWPLAEAAASGVVSRTVLGFAVALAVGFAFVGMFAGVVLARAWRAMLGREPFLSRPAVITLALAALALGLWVGRTRPGA